MSQSQQPAPDASPEPSTDPAASEIDPLEHIFPVTGFSRADLKARPGLTDDEIRQLDDAAMSRIAARLEDYFVDTGFWEGLEIYARHELEVLQKRQPPASRDR